MHPRAVALREREAHARILAAAAKLEGVPAVQVALQALKASFHRDLVVRILQEREAIALLVEALAEESGRMLVGGTETRLLTDGEPRPAYVVGQTPLELPTEVEHAAAAKRSGPRRTYAPETSGR